MLHLKEHLAGKRHVIWDWNGTLLDDLELTVAIVGDTTEKHIGRRLSRDEYLKYFRFPISAYYEEIGFDFTKVTFEQLSHEFITCFEAGVRDLQLFDGVHELLEALRTEGIACSILTAAPELQVQELLRHFGIDGHFHAVFGLSDNFARSKVERGRQLMAHLGLDAADLVLVGDTDHDLEVAKALGIDAILLTGGHQCPTRLQRSHHRVFGR